MHITLIKDKNFYKSFFMLAGALILEQVVVLSVNLADNVMIGSYSEASLAGVAAVNQIQFIVQQIVFAVSSGMIVLTGQYWGKGQPEPIRQLAANALRFGVIFAFGFFLAASIFPGQIVAIFVNDEAVITEGIRYLEIIKLTYLFFAVTTVFLGVMRSVETVKLALGVSIISLAVNCCINFVLITGRFGAPELGVQGAAIGTLTARALECVIVCCYVMRCDKKLHIRLSHLLHVEKLLRRDYFYTAVPVILQGALWGMGNAMQMAILGHLSKNALAAYSISSTIFQLLKVTSVGACTAASILIGKQIGKGDREELKAQVNTMQLLFLGIGALLCLMLNIIRIPLLSVYSVSKETYQLANQFIFIQSIVLLTMSYQMPTNGGIIRGGGDTRYGVVLDAISIWGIVLPLSYLAAFVLHWHPAVVVICLNFDQVFKCIPAAVYVNSYKWVRELTRE